MWGVLAALWHTLGWLVRPWRWFARAASRQEAAKVPAAVGPPRPELQRPWREMPRVGKAGTATDAQVEALMALRLVPAPPCRDLHDYSTEEAQLFLDAVDYARAVVSQVTGGEDRQAPPEVLTELLNELMAEILADQELRSAAQRWVRNGSPRPLRENSTFAKARVVVLRYWQPA